MWVRSAPIMPPGIGVAPTAEDRLLRAATRGPDRNTSNLPRADQTARSRTKELQHTRRADRALWQPSSPRALEPYFLLARGSADSRPCFRKRNVVRRQSVTPFGRSPGDSFH